MKLKKVLFLSSCALVFSSAAMATERHCAIGVFPTVIGEPKAKVESCQTERLIVPAGQAPKVGVFRVGPESLVAGRYAVKNGAGTLLWSVNLNPGGQVRSQLPASRDGRVLIGNARYVSGTGKSVLVIGY